MGVFEGGIAGGGLELAPVVGMKANRATGCSASKELPRRVMCVYWPYLATDCLRGVNQDHRRCVGVTNGSGGGSGTDAAAPPMVLTRRSGSVVVVVQADARARGRGVRIGLTLAQARARVPDLVAQADDPQRNRALLYDLARAALCYSPVVQPFEPDKLLLDITGCQRLFGGEANIGRRALAGFRARGLHTRVAIADTVGAAWALATAGAEPLEIAPVGQTVTKLAPLPPAALRIEDGVAAQLDALGIRTIGDLLMLPRSVLPARFGAGLVRRLQQALGDIPEEISACGFGQPPAVDVGFEVPVRDRVAVGRILARLLADLYRQLEERVLALVRLDCVLTFEDVAPCVFEVALSRATQSWEHVSTLVQRRLEMVDLAAGLLGLRLIAARVERFRGGQIELFEPVDPAGEEDFGRLLDRLCNRLGPDGVVVAELVPDYQPEFAFRYRRFAETVGGRVAPAIPVALPRPARLLPRPLLIRVSSSRVDGLPVTMTVRGREVQVVRVWGPERIETGWWRGPDVRRDYYRVLTGSGGRLWVFCDRTDGRWYWHGTFA